MDKTHEDTVYPDQSIEQREAEGRVLQKWTKRKILNDRENKIKRWLEHFSEILNKENPKNPLS